MTRSPAPRPDVGDPPAEEALDDFLTELDATAVDQRGRRAHLRYALTVPAVLRLGDGSRPGDTIHIRCFRMGNAGVCCVSGVAVPAGQACTVTFTTNDRRRLDVPAHILHCRGFGFGRCELAVRFDEPVDVAMLVPAGAQRRG